MKTVWCVELIDANNLYVNYFNNEQDAHRDANRVFQTHTSMPVVFKTTIAVG